jgi:hypothetical protein
LSINDILFFNRGLISFKLKLPLFMPNNESLQAATVQQEAAAAAAANSAERMQGFVLQLPA